MSPFFVVVFGIVLTIRGIDAGCSATAASIYTNASLNYVDAGINLTNSSCFFFNITPDVPAPVAGVTFLANPNDYSSYYQLALYVWNSSLPNLFAVALLKTGVYLYSATTYVPTAMAQVTKTVWMTWQSNGLIEVGLGSIPGSKNFLIHQYQDPAPLKIKYAVLGIGSGSCRWSIPAQFYQGSVACTPGCTSSTYLHHYDNSTCSTNSSIVDQIVKVNNTYVNAGADLSETNSVKFAVMSCNPVNVALGPVNNFTTGSPYYEFALKSTFHSIVKVIVDNGISQTWVQNCPLSCSSYQWFWIQWTDAILTLGCGNQIAQNVMLVFSDPDGLYAIKRMGIRTNVAATSTWTIPGCYYTPSTTGPSTAPSVAPTVSNWHKKYANSQFPAALNNCFQSRGPIACAQLCNNDVIDGCYMVQYGVSGRQCCLITAVSNTTGQRTSNGWNIWAK